VAVELRTTGENSSVSILLPNNSLVLSAKLDLLGKKYREEAYDAVNDRGDFLKANLTNISVGYDAAMLRSVPFLPADLPWDFFLGHRNATGVAAGDLNGDGLTDLAACYMEDGVAGFFPGRADGSFRAFVDNALEAGSRPVAVSTGDVTGDGLADLVVADQALKAVWVLAQNASTHRLDSALKYPADASLTDLVTGDFDADGLLDVAAASFSPCCVTVFTQGSTTHLLSSRTGYQLGSPGASSIAAADIDGDLRTDILAAAPNGYLYFLKQQPGGFATPDAYPLDNGYTVGAVAAGDVNGSYPGNEVLVSCANSAYQGFQLFYSTGAGLAWGALTKFPTDLPNQPPLALGADDVDGDGLAEAVIGLNSLGSSNLTVVNRSGGLARTGFFGPARELLTTDLDGDGRKDVAAACPQRNGLAVLRQNSTGSLSGPEELRFAPSSIAVGDLNGDGRRDIAVSSRYCDRVGIRFMVAAGQYGPLQTVGPVNDPVALGIADLDGDGQQDLSVLCRGNDTLAVAVQGAGTLRSPVFYPVGRYPSALALGDVTGDGRVDVVVAQAGERFISVLSQTSGGELSADEDYIIGSGASALALADLNSDGRTDVAVSVRSAGTVRVLNQTISGKLELPAAYGVGAGPVSVSAGDFDMDRRADLVVASTDPPSLTFLFQNSSGGLDASPGLSLASTPVRAQLAEVDRDGLPEVWVLFRDGNLSMHRSDSYGGLLPAHNYTTERDHGTVLFDDIDGNGNTDVVLAMSSSTVYALVPQELQNGKARTISTQDGPSLLQKADLDRDGLVDLLVASNTELWVYHQTPGGGFAPPQVRTWTPFLNFNYASGLAAGDLNSDGWPDVAVTGSYITYASVFYGGPAGLSNTRIEVGFGSTYAFCYGGLAIADLTGDGLQDLARTNYYGSVNIAAQTTSGGLDPPSSVSVGSYLPNGMAAGNLNGDGYTDLVVANSYYSRVYALLGSSTGSFDTTTFSLSGSTSYYNAPVVISDLNGDGRNDFAVLCGSTRKIDLFLQNEDGTFAEKVSLPVSTSDTTGSGMDAGDLDADGRNELVASNPGDGNLTIFDQDAEGNLFELASYTTGNAPHGVAVADLNSDGARDIAVANGGSDDLSVFYQVARHGVIDLPAVHVPGGFLDMVTMTWNQTPPAPGCSLTASVSLNGQNWTQLANGTGLAFAKVSQTMYRRLELHATSTSPLGVFNVQTTYIHSSFPTDPYLDAGADGTLEWSLKGNFSSKVTVSGEGLVAAINQYIQSHRATPGPDLLVPLALGSATEGVLEVTNISVEYDEPPFLARPFPAGLSIDEDTANNELVDLLSIFADDYDHGLFYEILDLTNGSVVNVTIADNAWLSVDAASWEASHDWSGEVSFRIRVTDSRGLSNTTGPVVVRIMPVNDPPVITSSPPLNATVGVPYSYRMVATDAEHEPLTFLLEKGLAGMQLNSTSGYLVWSPRGEHLGLADLEVAVKAFDGEVYSAVQRFTLSLRPDLPPVITSTPPLSVFLGETLVYRVNASDPDNGSLTYKLQVSPAGMAIGPDGTVTWSPSSAQVGPNDVQISVSDGYNSVIQNFRIEVLPRPVENRRPSILSLPLLNATVNRTYTYQVQALDEDNDPLRFSLEPAPQGMTIDNETGLVSWTPREWQVGNSTVVVRVSDGKASAAQLFVVHVKADDVPVKPEPGRITVRAGSTWIISLSAMAAAALVAAVLLVQARRRWSAPATRQRAGATAAPAGSASPAVNGEAGSEGLAGPDPRGTAPAGALPPAAEEPVVEMLAYPDAETATRLPWPESRTRPMPLFVAAPPEAPAPAREAPSPEDYPQAEPWAEDDALAALEPVAVAPPRTSAADLGRLARAPAKIAAPPPANEDQIDEIFKLLGGNRPPAPPPLAVAAAPRPPRPPPLAPRPPLAPTLAPETRPPPPAAPAPAPQPAPGPSVQPVQPRRDLNRTLEELMKMKKQGT